MKSEYVPLNKLSAQTVAHKVLVRVLEKCRPQTSANNNKYQNLLISDEFGNKMRATLFNDDIDGYADIIKVNGLYEIANPNVKPLPPRFQSYPDEHQMTLHASTSIHTIEQPPLDDQPNYHSIASVPRTSISEDRIDILGIVLYAEPVREVIGVQGRKVDVREIVITDSSSSRTMTISLLNDLANRGTSLLEEWAHKQSIIGFISLRATTYKGFSLGTTMSSRLIDNPSGERVEFLAKWQKDNKRLLAERLQQVKEARGTSTSNENKILTIAQLKAKKADNIMQEQKVWIKVSIPMADNFELRPYVACSYCAKQTKAPPGNTFTCPNCKKEEAKALPRASFTFEAQDNTGTLKLTAFGLALEKLLKKSCADIYELHKKDEATTLNQITKSIENVEFLAQLTPANSLSRNGILKWVLRAVKIPVNKDTKPDGSETGSNVKKEHISEVTSKQYAVQSGEPETNAKTSESPIILQPQTASIKKLKGKQKLESTSEEQQVVKAKSTHKKQKIAHVIASQTEGLSAELDSSPDSRNTNDESNDYDNTDSIYEEDNSGSEITP